MPSFHPVVAVPARNEEERLPQLIGALARQTWLAGGHRLPVVIVCNNCTDASAAVARAAAVSAPHIALRLIEVTLTGSDNHVGIARRMAMEEAAASGATVILTTDADARPAPDWVLANLIALRKGADIVAGHLVGDEEEERRLGPGFMRRARLVARYQELLDRLAALIDPLPYDPWPRHSDHTGASLALRTELYCALGGLPPLPHREDLALVSRARAQGARLRHAPDVEVIVSARLEGRAKGGMADCIATWLEEEEAHRPLLVEAPERAEARFRLRRRLRDLAAADGTWRNASTEQTLSNLPVSAAEPPLALIERLAGDEPDAPRTMPVEEALSYLEERLNHAANSFAA
ncbi:glycosyltransferase [Afifella sp. YEN Y35]|uniref:glycosyltransferase n=1 Tax=Afifella sp. YEN Y35 TaxID=3388337 RepID=UPI0039E0B882